MQDQIDELKAVIAQLPAKDQGFAQSLLASYAKYGSLTAKQAPWVGEMIKKAKKPASAELALAAGIGEVTGIIALFDKAGQKLKYPAITMQVDGSEIRITKAHPGSKNPGHLYVYYGGYYAGKVSPQGDWFPLMKTEAQGFIWSILKKFAENPAQTAAEYGKMSGKCCFCNSELTDPKSTDVGYGPVCAKNYGLPHGKPGSVASTAAVLAEAPGILKQGFYGISGSPELADKLPENQIDEEVALFEQEQMKEKAERRKVEFDKTPGQAVNNLMKALYGE